MKLYGAINSVEIKPWKEFYSILQGEEKISIIEQQGNLFLKHKDRIIDLSELIIVESLNSLPLLARTNITIRDLLIDLIKSITNPFGIAFVLPYEDFIIFGIQSVYFGDVNLLMVDLNTKEALISPLLTYGIIPVGLFDKNGIFTVVKSANEYEKFWNIKRSNIRDMIARRDVGPSYIFRSSTDYTTQFDTSQLNGELRRFRGYSEDFSKVYYEYYNLLDKEITVVEVDVECNTTRIVNKYKDMVDKDIIWGNGYIKGRNVNVYEKGRNYKIEIVNPHPAIPKDEIYKTIKIVGLHNVVVKIYDFAIVKTKDGRRKILEGVKDVIHGWKAPIVVFKDGTVKAYGWSLQNNVQVTEETLPIDGNNVHKILAGGKCIFYQDKSGDVYILGDTRGWYLPNTVSNRYITQPELLYEGMPLIDEWWTLDHNIGIGYFRYITVAKTLNNELYLNFYNISDIEGTNYKDFGPTGYGLYVIRQDGSIKRYHYYTGNIWLNPYVPPEPLVADITSIRIEEPIIKSAKTSVPKSFGGSVFLTEQNIYFLGRFSGIVPIDNSVKQYIRDIAFFNNRYSATIILPNGDLYVVDSSDSIFPDGPNFEFNVKDNIVSEDINVYMEDYFGMGYWRGAGVITRSGMIVITEDIGGGWSYMFKYTFLRNLITNAFYEMGIWGIDTPTLKIKGNILRRPMTFYKKAYRGTV